MERILNMWDYKQKYFLKEALDLIVEARTAVTMTYPVAYYTKFTENQKSLFEHQQATLCMVLDELDEYTDQFRNPSIFFDKIIGDVGHKEYDMPTKFQDFKSNIIDRTVGVTKAFNNLLLYMETELAKECAQQKEKDTVDVPQFDKTNDIKKLDKFCRVQRSRSKFKCNIF